MKKLLSTNAVSHSSPLNSRLNCLRDSASLRLQGRLHIFFDLARASNVCKAMQNKEFF